MKSFIKQVTGCLFRKTVNIRITILILFVLVVLAACTRSESDLDNLTGLYEVSFASINLESCDVEGQRYDRFPKYFQIYYPDNDIGIIVEDCDGNDLSQLTCGGLRGTEIGTLPMREAIPDGWRDSLIFGFPEFNSCIIQGDVTSIVSVGEHQVKYSREQRSNFGIDPAIFAGMCSNAGAETLFYSSVLNCGAYTVAYAELIQRELVN